MKIVVGKYEYDRIWITRIKTFYRINAFFGRKSPKALYTRTKLEGVQTEGKEMIMEQNNQQNIQGALSPLLGDLGGQKGHPSEDTGAESPSRAPVGVSEVRGRSSRDSRPDQKRVLKTLESWVQGPSKKTEGLALKARGLRKRALEDNQPRKEGFKDIRTWFERKGSAQEHSNERKDLKLEPGKEPERKEPTGLKPK